MPFTHKGVAAHNDIRAAFRQNSESRASVRPKIRCVHNMDARAPIHFARIDFHNDGRVFGIKDEDRFLHVYVIGKTGTGKSTLIETMALQNLERGNGFALIDPHGDFVARVAASATPPASTAVSNRSMSSHRSDYFFDRVCHCWIATATSVHHRFANQRMMPPT